MKRFYLLTVLMALFATTSLFAQSNYQMVVEQANGNKSYFKSSDIKKVYFEALEDDNDNDAIEDMLSGDDVNFENGTLGHWANWAFNGQGRIISPGHNSSYCVALETESAVERPNLAGQIEYFFNTPLETGKTYRIQFYAKSNKANSEIDFRYQNGDPYDQQMIHSFNIGKDWTLCQYDFIIPENYWDVTQICIDFSYVPAIYYVDDVRFGLLKNGGSGNSDPVQTSLSGTWYVVREGSDYVEVEGYTFNADGTAKGYEAKLRASNNYAVNGEQYNCRYTLSGSTLTITESDGDAYVYTITSNNDGTMTFRKSNGKSEVYTRLADNKTPDQLIEELAAKYRNGGGTITSSYIVGQWNVVSSTYKRYEDDVLVKDDNEVCSSPYNRIAFYDNGTVAYLEYSSSRGYHEEGVGTYSMDGTAFVYGSGEFDYFEITSYDGNNTMEVVYQFSSNKSGTKVRKVFRDKLQRVTEGENDNPNPTQTSLSGTWYVVREGSDYVEVEGYTFNADGTAKGYEAKLRASNNYAVNGEQYNCRYTLSGSTLTITESDGDAYVYTITSNNDGTMTFRKSNGKSEVYTRLADNKTPDQLIEELAAKYRNGGGTITSSYIVGQWNVVSSTYKRYEDDVLVKDDNEVCSSPYNRIAFYDNGTVAYLEYSSSRGYHEEGVGTYSMDGTAFVYGSGEFDYFEITSYDGNNTMEVVYQFSSNKSGTKVRKVFREKLQRVTE